MPVIQSSSQGVMLSGQYLLTSTGFPSQLYPEATAIYVTVTLSAITIVANGTVTIKLMRSFDGVTYTAIDDTGALGAAPATDAFYLNWRECATNGFLKPTWVRADIDFAGDTVDATCTVYFRQLLETRSPLGL